MFVPPKRLYICIDTGLHKYDASSSSSSSSSSSYPYANRRYDEEDRMFYRGGAIISKNYKEYDSRMSGINGTLIQDAGVLFNPYKKLSSADIHRHPSEILSKYPDILKYQFLNEDFFKAMQRTEKPLHRVFVDVNDVNHILTEKNYSTLVESGFAVTANSKEQPGPDIEDPTILTQVTPTKSNTQDYKLKSTAGVKVFTSNLAKIRSEDHATKYVKTLQNDKGGTTAFVLKDILDLGERAEDGTIRNNIQLTLETLFKRGTVLQIDGKKYIIYDFKCNYSNWRLLPCKEPKLYCSGGKYNTVMNSFKPDISQFITVVKQRFATAHVKPGESSKKITGLVLSAFKSFCDSFSLTRADTDSQFKKILRVLLGNCLSLYALNVPSKAMTESTTINQDFFIDISKTISEIPLQSGGSSAVSLLKQKFEENKGIFRALEIGDEHYDSFLKIIKHFEMTKTGTLFNVLAELINEHNNKRDKVIKKIDEYELTREFMKYSRSERSFRRGEEDGMQSIDINTVAAFMYEKHSLSICVFKYVNNDMAFCPYIYKSSSWITFLVYDEADNEFSSLKIGGDTLFKSGLKAGAHSIPEFIKVFLSYYPKSRSRDIYHYGHETIKRDERYNQVLDDETGIPIGLEIDRMFLKCSNFSVKIEYFGDDYGRESSVSSLIDYKLGYFIDVKLELKEWSEKDESLLKNTCNVKYTKILQDLKDIYKEYSKWLPKSRAKNKAVDSLYKGIYRNINNSVKKREEEKKNVNPKRRAVGGTRKKVRLSKGSTRRRAL